MGKVYNTQDYITIKAEYFANVSDEIASGVIKYIDPDGAEGQWPAEHVAIDKQFVYEVPKGTTLKAGKWRAWSYATMKDGKKMPGEPDEFIINTEGT